VFYFTLYSLGLRLGEGLPASYFLLTFTLPVELRELAWRHQRTLYAMLFDCAWATVNTFSQNDKHLQGKQSTFCPVFEFIKPSH